MVKYSNRLSPLHRVLKPVVSPVVDKKSLHLAVLLESWDKLMSGNPAARTIPVKITYSRQQDGKATLTLAASNSLAARLQHSVPTIIQRANMALGASLIDKIRFKPWDGVTKTGDKHKLEVAGSPPNAPERENDQLNLALERLSRYINKK